MKQIAKSKKKFDSFFGTSVDVSFFTIKVFKNRKEILELLRTKRKQLQSCSNCGIQQPFSQNSNSACNYCYFSRALFL